MKTAKNNNKTDKNFKGYNFKSEYEYYAKSAEGYSARSALGACFIATKMWGDIEVPEAMSSKSHPYMYYSMRLRDSRAGIRKQHAGVVLANAIRDTLVTPDDPRGRHAVRRFCDIAETVAIKHDAHISINPVDVYSYMSGRCQPKADKSWLLTATLDELIPGFAEYNLVGYSTRSGLSARAAA